MALNSLVVDVCIIGAVLALGSYLRHRVVMRSRNPQGLPYPPGPRQLPIIGNLLDMPRSHYPLTHTKWLREYGPLTYLVAMGQPILVINSFDMAKDLLDKKSSNYINRPRMVMAGELCSIGKATGMTQFGPIWKKERRYLGKALSGAPIVKRDYSALMIKRATILLKSILDRPEDFLWEVKKMAGHVVIEVGYGAVRDDEDGGHDYIDMQIELGVITAKTLSDQEMSLPSSFVRNTLRDLYSEPPSDPQQLREDEDAIKYSSFSFYRAGSDTVESVIRSFLLAMSLYPDIQAKARAEVEHVIGPDRLPTVDDRGVDKMPYVEAVMLEALRWNPPTGSDTPKTFETGI
ncbi:hypothetical protein FRC04_010790 [Tulasnella sp. 424]|nr:hypothetical protein FRC04_010790 [Tulasnella sp. 424]